MKPFHLFAITFLFAIISCKSKTDAGDPVAVTKEFVAATNEDRLPDARKMSTANYQPVLDQLEKRLATMSKEDRNKLRQGFALHPLKYEVKTKTDDLAEVIVFSDASALSIIFTLKNVNGKWMIDRQDENF